MVMNKLQKNKKFILNVLFKTPSGAMNLADTPIEHLLLTKEHMKTQVFFTTYCDRWEAITLKVMASA